MGHAGAIISGGKGTAQVGRHGHFMGISQDLEALYRNFMGFFSRFEWDFIGLGLDRFEWDVLAAKWVV